MKTKSFKDIQLSLLGMGNMRLPKDEEGNIDYKKAQEIIDYVYDHGINYYDTAYVYHTYTSEDFLGHALKKYPRDSYFLATKYYINARNNNYEEVFEEQLKKLQTDYIDFYLIHCITDKNYQDYFNNGCIEYFNEQRKLGRIKYLGFSSHASVETLEKFADANKWDFAQIQLNYFDYLYSTAKQEYEVLTSRNIPIMVMESIRGGRLADLSKESNALLKECAPDLSIASWALRWLISLDNVQVMLSGMSTLDQAKDNIHTLSLEPLNKKETELLFKACELFKKEVSVPCTECRYCTDECPMQINIPAYLKVYNKYKTDGKDVIKNFKDVDSEGLPEQCIQCRLCEGHCPQSIQIPELMQEIGELMK